MWTSAASASAVIPANIVIESPPMITSVEAALRLFGCSNAGNAVRDRLDAGQRGAAGGERAQDEEDDEEAAGVGDLAQLGSRRSRR